MTSYYVDYNPYLADYSRYPQNYVSPYIDTFYNYPNVNKDENLRKEVTRAFYKRILNKIDGDNYKLKKLSKKKLYKILRKYVNKYNVNWYDLHRVKKSVIKYAIKKLD